MITYTPMRCECGRVIEPEVLQVEKPRPATAWASCVFKCECGLAYSNSIDPGSRRRIAKTPEYNVPAQVACGLDGVLRNAFNVMNRANKRAKFCSENSEDAVTWTVFRYVGTTRQLDILAQSVGLTISPETSPAVLFWGVPIDESATGNEVLARLIKVSDDLCEDPNRRTELDIIVAWPDALVVMEVKYKSSNLRQPDYPNFSRYLDDKELFAVASCEVERIGYYELVRNWRIGAGLAGGRDLVVVNLGCEAAVRDANAFALQLSQSSNRRFVSLHWRDFLGSFGETAPWFRQYIAKRGLL